jgi:hypothetical protein
MATEFANRRPRLDADGLARWLDQVAAGPILLAVTIVALVTTIARLG